MTTPMPLSRLLLAALVLLALPTASGQGRMAFDADLVDLGRVAEAGGPVSHTFRFTNAGDAPLRLVAVDVACGCTTPSWTQTSVEPGASGTVEVAYDPAGRPGGFEKAVFVRADGADPSTVTLRVEGTVRPAIADTGERIGALAFQSRVVDLDGIPAEDGYQTSVQYANVGDRPVRIDSVSAPAGVEVVFSTKPVFQDAVGGLFVTAQHARVGRQVAGRTTEVDLVLYTDDASEPVKTVRVSARHPVLRAPTQGTIDATGGRE